MKSPQYVYHGVVTKVIDGDTIDVIIHLGFMISTQIRFRLNGVDTMEVNDTNPVKREFANLAKKFMTEKCLEKEVVIQSYKTDKYGRWLADVFLVNSSKSLNTMLVEEGLATVYDGGKR